MAINKLIFEKNLYDIKFFAPHGKRKFELGTIRPTVDKEFVINSEHFELTSYESFIDINSAKKFTQDLFEKWVNDFSIDNFKNEYFVE